MKAKRMTSDRLVAKSRLVQPCFAFLAAAALQAACTDKIVVGLAAVDAGDAGPDAGDAGIGDGGRDGGSDAGDGGLDAGDAGPPTSCTIGGMVYAARALNPASLSQCCNPRTPNDWTPLLVAGKSHAMCAEISNSVARDLNGDGIVDLAVCCRGFPEIPANPGIQVYLGVGDGGLAEGPFSPITHHCYDMTWGPMTGSGAIDLIVGYERVNLLAVLLNMGGGAFGGDAGGELDFEMGNAIARVAVGDFNADGWPDVAYEDFDAGIYVLFNLAHGDGALGNRVTLPNKNPGIGSLRSGDFNGDGIADVAFAPYPGFPNTVLSLYLSDGGGGFQQVFTDAPSPVSFSVANLGPGSADDLVSTTLSEPSVFVVGANLQGFMARTAYYTGITGGNVITADLNGDGLIDIIQSSSPPDQPKLCLLFNHGDGGFSPPVTFYLSAFLYPPDLRIAFVQTVNAADLNSDGATDLVLTTNQGAWFELLNGCPPLTPDGGG
jgi:hypothetical protein